MARIISQPQGELAGKLGGTVYSKNKSGNIARAFTKPANPQTGNQIKQRALFGQASRIFRSLNDTERTQWQEFADNIFSPKTGVNTGQFSGYNAFMALRNVVNQARRVFTTSYSVIPDGATPITVTDDGWEHMPSPPIALGYSGVWEDANGDPVSLAAIDSEVTSEGDWEVKLQINDGSGTDISGNQSPNGYKPGFLIFMSNGKAGEGQAVQNRFAYLIGAVNPFTLDTPADFSDVGELTLTAFGDALNIGGYRRFPLKDEWVTLSIYGVNKYGQLAQIDSIETKVLDSLTP